MWALSQRAEARQKALAADASALSRRPERLEANALVKRDTDPELGLLLATDAARLAPTAATKDVLIRMLRESRVRTVARLGSPVSDLAVLPSGTLAAVTEDGGVQLVRGGTAGRVVVPPRRGAQTWLSDDQALTVRGATLTVRRLPKGDVIATVPVPPDTRFAASEPQARKFIVAGKRGARVVDAEGHVLATMPHPARVHRATFSPNGLLIATAGADGDAIVWSSSGAPLRSLPGPADSESNAFDVSFSPLSRLLVVASSDGVARVWNVRNGHRESVMPLHGSGVRRASFGVNEDSVLTASRDRTARTWKVTTGGPRTLFAGHLDTVNAAVFIPGGDYVATASDDGTVRTWVARQQPPLRRALSTSVPRVDLDPRARVSGSTVTLRLPGRRRRYAHPRTPRHRALGRVLPRRLAGRDGEQEDGDARLWDARTGRLLWVLRRHSGTVFDASFSPNGRWVVTGGRTTAGLWDTAEREFIYFLRGDGGPIRAAMFSSPTRIVTRGDDGVRVHECEICGGLHKLVALAEQRLATTRRQLSAEERSTYLGRALAESPPCCSSSFALLRQSREARQQEVVERARRQDRRQQAAGARSEDLRRGQAGADPGADAASTGDELSDRLLHLRVVRRLLVLAVVRLTFDERVADEARHLVARDVREALNVAARAAQAPLRPTLLLRAIARGREAADGAETGDERADDRGVGAVRRARCRAGHGLPCTPMAELKTSAGYVPTGDQPRAIEELARSLQAGERYQTLLGATGTGKTATMAWIIEQLQRPALVIAHNKTLAAQLCNEFREFFPRNAVEYFVSYYDYYQPEAYVPQADLYIEKDSLAERRHRPAAPRGDLEPRSTRRDTVIVASVSCIYGLGSPEEYEKRVVFLDGRRGDRPRRDAAEADRHPVRPQRHAARPRPLPGQGRRDRDPAGLLGDRLPGLDVRRRGRADHALRPAHRRGLREARHAHRLPGDAVRHLEADDRARARTRSSTSWSSRWRCSSARAGCSRRTGSASAPSTTWR